MKTLGKKLGLFIVLVLLYVIAPTDIFAANYGYSMSRANECVNNGTCNLICGYTNEVRKSDDILKENWNVYGIYIYYSITDEVFFVESQYSAQNIDKFNNWDKSSFFKSSYATKKIKKGECPRNAYAENDGLIGETCFDDNSNPSDGYCIADDPGGIGTKFSGTSILKYSLMDNDIRPYLNRIYDFVECKDFIGKKTEEIEDILTESFHTDWKNYSTVHKLPQFIIDQINSEADEIVRKELVVLQNRCSAEWEQDKNEGTITDDEKTEAEDNLNDVNGDQILDDFEDTVNEDEEKEDKDDYKYVCQTGLACDLFCMDEGGTWSYIQMLYNLVRIAIPVAVIVLGMIDFLSVVFSGEEKDMKSAGQRFLKRVIIGVVFILLPELLQFIFGLVGFSEDCLEYLIKISL